MKLFLLIQKKNRYKPNQSRHPENGSAFSKVFNRCVVMTAYKLSGEVRKQAVIKIHLGVPDVRGFSGKKEQNGHSISPSSLWPQREHFVMPRASLISSGFMKISKVPS
jgi:hypothetical protein